MTLTVAIVVCASVWAAVLICAFALCRAAAIGDRIQAREAEGFYRQYPSLKRVPVAPLHTADRVTAKRSRDAHKSA